MDYSEYRDLIEKLKKQRTQTLTIKVFVLCPFAECDRKKCDRALLNI
ncbi:hypothetical protein [Rivularia sp. UHCC 0363]|nr:hypothetical protein [Rivularia sp. UHCC 0363]MEA5598233.1 hypothetical protein [Rivularia sp. UHCC 0363]